VLAGGDSGGFEGLLAIAPEGNLGLLEQRRDGFGAGAHAPDE
jgi:hypothetical protein